MGGGGDARARSRSRSGSARARARGAGRAPRVAGGARAARARRRARRARAGGRARAVVRMLTPDGGGRRCGRAERRGGGARTLRAWAVVDLVAQAGRRQRRRLRHCIRPKSSRGRDARGALRRPPMASWINDSMAGDDVALRVGGAMMSPRRTRARCVESAWVCSHARVRAQARRAEIATDETTRPSIPCRRSRRRRRRNIAHRRVLATQPRCAYDARRRPTLPRGARTPASVFMPPRAGRARRRLENTAEAAEAAGGRLRLVAHVTGDRGGDGGEPSLSRRWEVRSGRVTPQALQEAFDELAARLQRRGNTTEGEGPTTVACGPPAATDAWARALAELRPTPTAVLTERWW